MEEITKGKSPFYPGQPVPLEFFVGRQAEIERIITRGVRQVELGKSIAIFVQGEYGIGKSSIAGYVQAVAEKQHNLHGVYASLGGCRTLSDMATQILEATVRSGALYPTRSERIRNWLGKYIGKQELFGISLNLDALRADAPNLTSHGAMLSFLREVRTRLSETGVKGIFLILDEVNGISAESQFSYFLKSLIDTNAVEGTPVPLLLMICGVEERRREMIRCHQPIDRIFDIVDIGVMNTSEMSRFFERAFQTVSTIVKPEAMDVLCHYSAGFPKIMHLIGDCAFWSDKDGVVTDEDAFLAVVLAAEEVGKKFVDAQIIKVLKSEDYQSILQKIGGMSSSSLGFSKSEVDAMLTSSEKAKLGNFLQRLKKLQVLRSGEAKGEWVFTMRMVRLYLWLKSTRAKDKTPTK